MNRELYTAASGLIFENTRLELTTNNLANVGTDGFRARRAFASAIQVAGADGPSSVTVGGTYAQPGPGALQHTGRGLDLALMDEALLAVDTPDGRRYTRAGSLQLDDTGRLVNADGFAILDKENQPIENLPPDAAIQGDGSIRDGEALLATLGMVRDPIGLLQQQGRGLHSAGGRDAELVPVDTPRLRSGWLAGSGSDPVGELVRLIETQRAFERYQRLLSLTMNEVNRQAVQEIAGR